MNEFSTDSKTTFAVVVPMFNEEHGAEECILKIIVILASLPYDSILIAVNDASKDETGHILSSLKDTMPGLCVIHHEKNIGYGAALLTGAREAHRLGYEYVLFMDSDLTNPPEHIPRFVEKMEDGFDLIKGSRYCPGGEVVGVPFKRYIISKVGNMIAKRLYRTGVTDCTNGFRAIKTELFLRMPLKEKGFVIIMEELFWAKKLGAKIVEIPTTLSNRSQSTRPTSFQYTSEIYWKYLKFPMKALVGGG
jgi:glycosyltransferase involved in cell wall biosynthesis